LTSSLNKLSMKPEIDKSGHLKLLINCSLHAGYMQGGAHVGMQVVRCFLWFLFVF
jgi:hypothetical protein